MTISEQSRHALFVRLESVLGEEVALTLMEHLPPVGWADVATKRDLDQLHVLTQRDISLATAAIGADVRAEMHQLGTDLRAEMHQLGTDLRAEMHQLGTELRAEMHQLGTELRAETNQLGERMFERMAAQTRTMVFTVLGSMATLGAITISAARLA